MSSLLCVVLLAMIVAPSSIAAAGSTSFEVPITSQLDYTNSEWFSTKTHRALLSILLPFESDALMKKDNLSLAVSGGAFVVDKDALINVFYRLNDKRIISLAYSSLLNTAYYSVLDVTINNDEEFRTVMKTVLEDNKDPYAYVSFSDLVEAAQLMDSIFNK